LVTDWIEELHSYDWILLLNSDCSFDDLDILAFLEVLDKWQPALAQPAVIGSYWDSSAPHQGVVGRVTNFVEIGPFVAISVKAWKKLRAAMNPLFTSGWGLDMFWCSLLEDSVMMFQLESQAASYGQMIGESMPCPNEIEFTPSCMVIDAAPLVHLDRREGRELGTYSEAIGTEEKHWYREKYSYYWNEHHRSVCSIYE